MKLAEGYTLRSAQGWENYDITGRITGRALIASRRHHQTGLAVVTREQHDFEEVPLALGRCNLRLKPPTSVLLLEGSRCSYMPTPAYGMDKVAKICRDNLPSGTQVISAIVNYENRKKVQSIRVYQNGRETDVRLQDLDDLFAYTKPGLLGVSGTSKELPVLLSLIAESSVQTSETLIVIGGIHVSVAGLETMQYFAGRSADIALPGRAEERLPQLLALLREGRFDDIPKLEGSLVYVRPKLEGRGFLLIDGEKVSSGSRCQKEMSLPKFQLPTSSEQRLAHWGEEVVARVQSSEGCPYNCTFCGVSALTLRGPYAPKRWIPYDLEHLKTFLDSLADDKRVSVLPKEKLLVYLEDAQVGGPEGTVLDRRGKALLALLKNYPYRFGFQCRYDTFIKRGGLGEVGVREDYMGLLKEAGVVYLLTSVESVDSIALKRMQKGQSGNLMEVYRVFEALKRQRIESLVSFIGGTKGETLGAATRTAAFIAEVLSPRNIAYETAKVYPGTRDGQLFREQRGIDVASAYTAGNGLASYGGEDLTPEDQGCLLQALREGEAGRLYGRVRDMILCRSTLRARFAAQFPPLGNGSYEELSPGFFVRR